MIGNYFKTAWRSLWNNKFYSMINISGLAVGLAAGIMLLLWVENELSYDKFNKGYQNIYQLSAHFNANGEKLAWRGVPGPLAVLARSIPGVQSLVRTHSYYNVTFSNEDKSKILGGNICTYADSGFFSMFTFPLVEGQRGALFSNLNSVVITESLARKLFANQRDAIGKVIGFEKESFIVTGVLQDLPGNSSIRFDALFPMGYYAKQFTAWGGNGNWKTIDEDMGNYAFETFVRLQPNANFSDTGEAFTKAYKKARNGESNTTFELQNLADIHLISADGNTSALRMVQIFVLVIVLLLAIAGINYVNLSTARSLIRAKEVSIRKIIGAKKGQLFFQFTTETALLFFMASILSILLITLLAPLYNSITGKSLSIGLYHVTVWKAAGMAIFGTFAASSIYPAVLLSSFRPLGSLKGKIIPGIGISALRKGLVVFQFAISVILLIGTIVMSRQMQYIRQKELGYDKSYVFTVQLPDEVSNHLDAIKNELRNDPAILNVAASDASNFLEVGSSTGDLDWPTRPPKMNMMISQISVDKEFIPAMKIKFLEGGNFGGTPADSSYYILNETAVKKMDLKPPYIGQQISFHNRKGTIKGIVRDFNFHSLRENISPLIFFTFWNGRNTLYVRTTGSNAQHAIATVEKQYKKYGSETPFGYDFLDKRFEMQYQTEERTGMLFNVFAAIAIFISCLGLFGLATFTAQVKIKEIGIRKVLGASVAGIVQLVSRDFLKLVIIAIIIAIPLAWWIMTMWLQSFAYRADISWWIFVISAALAIFIAVLTISFQAIKAAIANPVRSLRTE